MRISLKVEGLAKVRREIDRARKRLGLSAAEFSDEAAKVLRDGVMRRAQPFGQGNTPKKQGEGAVSKDLMKVFRVVGESGRGRAGVIDSLAEARRWHQQRKNKRGRTTRGERRAIVPSVFYEYRQKQLAKVGMAKGSLAGGLHPRLGGNLNKWTRRWANMGSARRRRKIGGAMWTFRAEARHVASTNVLGERGVRDVMKRQEGRLLKFLKRKIERELRKTQRRANKK